MITPSKTILITVSEGSIARNILRSFVLEKILSEPEIKIVLVVPPDKEGWYKKEFASDRVSIFTWKAPRSTLFSKLLFYLSRNGILTETVLTDQRTRLLVDKRYSSFLIKRFLIYGMGWSRVFHSLARFLASFRRSSQASQELFRRFGPGVLLATDVLDEMDFDLMSGAKKNGVKIVGMARSWDNLTSGGLALVLPDLLLLWNPFLYEKAVKVQHIPKGKLKIVGIPHYDWYTKKEIILPREVFLQKFNIDPSKKLILFAGIGNFLAPREVEVVEIVSEALKKGEIQGDAAVVFRPHPNFLTERERIKNLGNIIFDDSVADYSGKKQSSWEMDQQKISHLVNSLYHADLVITTASTITMDAVSFNKPVICVAFDGKSKEPYWNSVLRYYRDYTHYIEISKTKGFKIAHTAKELKTYINNYLENPIEDSEGRKRILDSFIWKLDGRSAQRVVEVILRLVYR